MLEILGVVNEMPVPREDPPVELAYQLIMPELDVAPSVTVPVPHRLPGVVDVMVGSGLTVTTIVNVLVQPPESAVTV